MKFEVTDHINYSHEEVFDVFLNHMEELPEFIPDVREIRVVEKSQKGNKAKRVNHWIVKRDMPGFIKKIINVDEVGWIDRAEWNLEENYVDYELEISGLEKYVRVTGRNVITPDGKKTKILISGELKLMIEKHPAVPRLVAKAIGPKMEKFFIELIKPNLVNSNRALEKYLKSKKKKK